MRDVEEPRRHIAVQGASNIRDIGGYATSDGSTTRWKTVLRADDIAGLPPESQRTLVDYGVRSVIDLRRAEQLELKPNVFAKSPDVSYYHHDFSGSDTKEELAARSAEAKRLVELADSAEGGANKAATYCLRLETRGASIREALSTLATPGVLPALYHCVAGKDRTGILTALLLEIAGVPRETVVEDYALSAYYRWRGSLAERGVAEPYENAPPESFDAEGYQLYVEGSPAEAIALTLEYLDERYGGAEEYVLSIGVTPDEIEYLRRELVV